MITFEWIEALKSLLDAANLDGAVEHIANIIPTRLDHDLDPTLGPRLRLRARCLICEVYDYAGRREEARVCIEREAQDVLDDLEAAKRDFEEGTWAKTWDTLDALASLKQECWACLHVGMVAHYRALDYTAARQRFELARDVLTHINTINRHGVLAPAALARALYCLGLVEREEHNLYEARKHFSDSIACAWSGIVGKPPDHHSIPFLKYSIGRALGLGMAWIAYTRATMSEATAHIVGARLLLQEVAGVRYLNRYVDVVHACCQRSQATQTHQIDRAIGEMKSAFDLLGGKRILETGEGSGHLLYAQRAAYELATAHVGASRLYGQEKRRREALLEDQLERKDGPQVVPSSDPETIQNDHPEIFATANPDTARVRVPLTDTIAALADRRQAHLEEALTHINAVEKSLQWTDNRGKDRRTRCNVFITKSRVFRERGELDGALVHAQAALAIGGDHPLSRIDCWLTLGELYYQRGEYERALKEFEKARKDRRAQTNPKILAVCDLQMALCYVKEEQIDVARKILSDWENRGSQGRSNSFVRYLMEEVRRELSEAAFVISGDIADEDLQRILDRAQIWLIDLALRRHRSEKDVYNKVGALFGLGRRGLKERRKALEKRLTDVSSPM